MEQNITKDNLFQNKNFVLVFFGALVSNIGAMLFNFAVSFYILEITDNDSFLQGVYLAVCGVTFVVFSLIGGVLCDKFNKAKIMYLCDYAKGALILASAIVLYFFQDVTLQIVILFVLGFATNVISAIFSPASSALLPFIVQEDKLQQANSLFSVLTSFQSIVGVILAGVLYAVLDVTALFVLVAVCYIASAVSEMFIRYNFVPSDVSLTFRSAVQDIGDGVKYLFGNRALTALTLSILFINFFFAPINDNFMPYFVKTDLALADSYLFDKVLTPEMWSSVMSVCFAVGSIVGGIILANKQYESGCSRTIKVWLTVVAFITIAFAVGYYLFATSIVSLNFLLCSVCMLVFALGVSLIYVNVPISTTLQIIVDKKMLGKVNGVLNVGSQGLIPFATFLAGVVISSFGTATLLFACAVGFVITDVLFVCNKSVNNL